MRALELKIPPVVLVVLFALSPRCQHKIHDFGQLIFAPTKQKDSTIGKSISILPKRDLLNAIRHNVFSHVLILGFCHLHFPDPGCHDYMANRITFHGTPRFPADSYHTW